MQRADLVFRRKSSSVLQQDLKKKACEVFFAEGAPTALCPMLGAGSGVAAIISESAPQVPRDQQIAHVAHGLAARKCCRVAAFFLEGVHQPEERGLPSLPRFAPTSSSSASSGTTPRSSRTSFVGQWCRRNRPRACSSKEKRHRARLPFRHARNHSHRARRDFSNFLFLSNFFQASGNFGEGQRARKMKSACERERMVSSRSSG